MAEHADFLGAVRLTSGAHEAAAGTRVVTDVLVFRSRLPGSPERHAKGFLDPPHRLGGTAKTLLFSTYFAAHPEQVLGEMVVGSGLYGEDLVVDGEAPPDAGLDEALSRIVAESGRLAPPLGHRSPSPEEVLAPESRSGAPVGRIEAHSLRLPTLRAGGLGTPRRRVASRLSWRG